MNIFAGGDEEGLFEAFTGSETNRRLFLESLLKVRDVPFSTVTLAKKEHIIVRFAGDAYNPFFRMKIIVAHYDRSERDKSLQPSPGANDNSAACFQLISLAESLIGKKDHNVIIVFSAGEEAGKRGVRFQGAYALAVGLKKLKDLHMVESDVFVVDACGRGDTLIVSSSGMNYVSHAVHAEPKVGKAARRLFIKRRQELYDRTQALARKSCPESWLTLPTPYSDNAGFAAAGIPAQLVTVLPHAEAESLLKEAARIGEEKLARSLASFNAIGKANQAAIPQTWKDMHTERDSISSLTPQAFALMEKFLNALASEKTPG